MQNLLVQCNAYQVDIGFGKGVWLFLHVHISVWTAPPMNACPDLPTEPSAEFLL